jgi:hypothetical protein
MDPRTGKPVPGSAGQELEEDDAHVVAGARAMMRYRRTRASSAEGSTGLQGQGPGPQSSAQAMAGGGSGKGWAADPYGAPQQKMSQQQLQQQQQQLAMQQQQQQQLLASQRATGKQMGVPQAGAQSSGWIGAPPSAQDRPKSASATVRTSPLNPVSPLHTP